ncbi:hypothetical protein V8B97DRAFT_2002888 [Scleroderma yunnanense]
MSATSEGWEFSHPQFLRTGTPKFTTSDILSPSDLEPGIEILGPVAYLLARDQDEISSLRREIDHLREHRSPHLGGSPRSQSPHSTAFFIGHIGKDNEEQASIFQPDPILYHPGNQGPRDVNSPSHLLAPLSQQVGSQLFNNPNVHIHPPTPGPASPQQHPFSEFMKETSPPFPVSSLHSPSGSPSQTFRGRPGYSPSSSGPQSTPSSEPSSSRSQSHVQLSPLMQSLSMGNEVDNFERRLDDSLLRSGMGGDVPPCPEYLDSNLASPDLADPGEVRDMVREIVDTTLEALPTHLINTKEGKLYERSALRSHFEASMVYAQLVGLLSTKSLMKKRDFIEEVIRTYFQYAMLSHKWELPNEALFHDLDNGVYTPDQSPRFSKLQNFCQVVRCYGLDWAWCDTCCINKDSTAELDEAIRSMFRWYRDSALTIVYFSDVTGFAHQDLVKSKWFKRGWTLQELLAPQVVRFYDKTWTPCVRGPEYNHKLVPGWLNLLEKATGIPDWALQTFEPGTENPRERLRWASSRSTTRVEDLGYCLFGIFDVALQPQYGEGEKAFGRLLVELIRTTQDTSLLDWVGKHPGRCSILPLNPFGFKEKPLIIEGPKSSNATSPGASNSSSPVPKPTSWLSAAGDGVLDVWCFLHIVKDNSRVSLDSPDVQRIGNDSVQYVIRADNLVEFSIVVSLKHALESISSSRRPFIVARLWEPAMNGQTLDKGSIISNWKSRERDAAGLMQPFFAMLLVKDQDGRGYSRIPTETRIIARLVKQPRDYHPTFIRLF